MRTRKDGFACFAFCALSPVKPFLRDQHLIEDLQDRAAIRTEGKVKRVLVRSLILE